MNIFEQYGIKEVADVTLYAIELNKYDDEVYIPIMYLDTLKVSTIEQTAEQSSARGGLGNPELITWDYGKEITVTLEDALFTPASQSLMWGGKFGTKNTKIYGVWNPYIYEKDNNGRPIWTTKVVMIANEYEEDNHGIYQPAENATFSEAGAGTGVSEEDLIKEGYIKFICPCDNHVKYMKYVENINGRYKYLKNVKEGEEGIEPTENQLAGFTLKCPKGFDIYENDEPLLGYNATEVFDLENWQNGDRPEFAELTVKNFGNFQFEQYSYKLAGSEDNQYCESTLGVSGEVTDKCDCAYSYVWADTDLLMTSLEGEQDVYLINDANLRIRTPRNSSDMQIMVANRNLYKTKCAGGVWDFESDEPVLGVENLSERYNIPSQSYAYKYDKFASKIDVYTNIKWGIPSLKGEELTYVTRIKVGTFYIIDDWNGFTSTPYENIYPINDGFENVQVLERMEKCKAPRTFCIDAKTNLACYNYYQLPQYSTTALTVYIDPTTMKPFEPNADSFRRANGQVVEGDLRIIKQHDVYYKWTRAVAPKYTSLGTAIIVDAIHYPGTYRLVGETYARSRDTGKDQRYQFEIPLAKMSSENNLTLQADGDPTTFTMTLKALRREDGVMMKLTQYNVDTDSYDGYQSDSTVPVPQEGNKENVWEDSITQFQSEIDLVEPIDQLFLLDSTNNVKTITPKAVLNTTSKTTSSSFNFDTMEFNRTVIENGVTKSRELELDEYTIKVAEREEEGEE